MVYKSYFLSFSADLFFQWRQMKAMDMRQTTRTTVRCASREERSFCVTPVPELIIWSVWTLTWRKHLRASGAAHTV